MPDRKKIASAERGVSNQIHYSDASGTCLIELEVTPTHRHSSR